MSKYDVTKTIRDIDTLHKNSQHACRLLFQELYKAGITNVFITETLRPKERQLYLYEQGRTRKFDEKGNKLKVVTWTKNSNHANGLAWDIAVGSPNSLYDNNVLSKVANIAKRLNITAGHFWKNNKDSPHFEVTANWTIPNGYKLEGVVSIPTSSKEKIKLVSSVSKLPQVELDVSDSKNNTQLDKGAIELQFTSPTLRTKLEERLVSDASEKMIIENAIKELGYNESWKSKDVENGDLISMAFELAIELIKEKQSKSK